MAHDVSCRVSGPVDTRTNVLGRHSSGRVGSCPRDQILLAVKVARQSLGDIETTYTLLLFYCEMYVFYWLFCIGCWATLTARQMSAVKNDSRHYQRLTVFLACMTSEILGQSIVLITSSADAEIARYASRWTPPKTRSIFSILQITG